MIPLTAETIARLKTLLEKATGLPWQHWEDDNELADPDGEMLFLGDREAFSMENNALAVAAVNALPALLASLEAVQAPTCATCQHCEGYDDQGEGVLCVQPEMVGRGYASFYYHAPKNFGCTLHAPLTRPATETT